MRLSQDVVTFSAAHGMARSPSHVFKTIVISDTRERYRGSDTQELNTTQSRCKGYLQYNARDGPKAWSCDLQLRFCSTNRLFTTASVFTRAISNGNITM